MKSIIFSAIALGLMATAGVSKAQAQTTINGNCATGWYYSGQSCTHYFASPTFVNRLTIGVTGNYSYGEVQVYADGEWVGRLGVPGRDPEYPVVVRRAVTSITLTFNSTISLNCFRIEVADQPLHQQASLHDINTPEGMAETALSIVSHLQETASMSDFNTYLKPIRKAALRMAAAGGGRPYLSGKTRDLGMKLAKAIDSAEPFLDRLADDSAYSDDVQTLYEVRERITSGYEQEPPRE